MKPGYCLELSTNEKMKLLGSNKSKITKDKNGENMPYLKTTEVVLVHCNTLLPIFVKKILESCITLFQINRLINY